MSVTINLKEIFASDNQEAITNKLTFNFNQLLSLGVGAPGIQGPAGPLGPVGPQGPIGPQGLRGNYIYAFDDPSFVTSPISGDTLYDTDDYIIKQYDGSTWLDIININDLIADAISSGGALGATFIRNALSDGTTQMIFFTNELLNTVIPDDERDILYLSDFKYKSDGSLTNWDDSDSSPSPNNNSNEKGILTIYNHGNVQGTDYDNKRYAIVLGSTNEIASPSEYANQYQTLRIRHAFDDNDAALTYITSTFNLSADILNLNEADSDSGFEFNTTNKSAQDNYSTVSDIQKLDFLMGPHNFLDYHSASTQTDKIDGFIIKKTSGQFLIGLDDVDAHINVSGANMLHIFDDLHITRHGQLLLNTTNIAEHNNGSNSAKLDLRFTSTSGLFANNFGSLVFGPVDDSTYGNGYENGNINSHANPNRK